MKPRRLRLAVKPVVASLFSAWLRAWFAGEFCGPVSCLPLFKHLRADFRVKLQSECCIAESKCLIAKLPAGSKRHGTCGQIEFFEVCFNHVGRFVEPVVGLIGWRYLGVAKFANAAGMWLNSSTQCVRQ